MDVDVSAKQIEQLTERAGRDRCAERDAAVDGYMSLPLVERKGKPAGVAAPDGAAVTVEGGRLQILDRSQEKPAATDAEAEKALLPDEQHRGTHWYEDKIAACLTLKSQEHHADPSLSERVGNSRRDLDTNSGRPYWGAAAQTCCALPRGPRYAR